MLQSRIVVCGIHSIGANFKRLAIVPKGTTISNVLPEPSHSGIGLMHEILSIFDGDRRQRSGRVEMCLDPAKQSRASLDPYQKLQAGTRILD